MCLLRVLAPADVERTWQEIDAKYSAILVEVAALEGKLGQNDALRAKHGECVSSSLGTYTYKLCFFDKVEQKEGHRWNNLGRFTAGSASVEACDVGIPRTGLTQGWQRIDASDPGPFPQNPMVSYMFF